ncbi:MAG: hypothetical protein H6624_07710 [Bdellovibrionaceae bacterium]|nr:hypothetical protein [Bdellovibrionales bacterium]MCB9084216.1 hypothetical protein [Pseudobdellovibrionaceae bacterium]
MERRLRTFAPIISLFVALGLSACSGDGGESGSGSSSTLSISGSLSTGVSSSSLGMYDLGAMDGACSDGNHYQIYCVTFSDSPTAASGSVVCNGGSSGTYTVSGIPKNTAFGCFVRSSTDGASFKTVGSIEVPATGALGDSDQIVASGDMGINVTINSDGSIDAAVTTDNRVDSSSNFTDASTFNGIYHLACDNSGGGTIYSQAACKCFLAEDSDYSGTSYNSGSDREDACLNDNASELTGSIGLYVDVNIYDATANSDISDNGQVIIKAGDRVQGVTVWGASNSTTSMMAGGEGLLSFASNMGLTWSDIGGFKSQAETAITWATTADLYEGGNSTTIPSSFRTLLNDWANNKNVGDWQTQLVTLIGDAHSAGDYTATICNSNNAWVGTSAPSNPNTDAGCIRDFVDRWPHDATLPRIHVEPACDYNGCDEDPTKMRVWIEGIEFNYTYNGETVASVTTNTQDSEGPSPNTRYVFEQWHPMPGGGGGFKQRHDDRRWYSCDDNPGKDVQHSSCSGTNGYDGLECFEEEELAIRFMPNGSTYNVIFESRTVVFGGQFHLESNTSGPVFSNAATDLCKSKAFSEWTFMATGTKQ